MSTKDQILWLDDDKSRKVQSDNLKEKIGIHSEFISLRNENVQKIIADIRSKYNPSLIIIDHVLSNTASGEWAKLGSTLVGFFRETWEKCPIIGITAGKNLKMIDTEKYAYDELVNFIDFGNYINCIPNIIKGFKQCSKVKDINEWIELLKPPKEEMERINTCIPHDMKIDVEKKGFASRAYSWFSKKLYRLPGFLYNKEWVATFIGVKIDAVDKYIKYLDDVKYDGIFNNPDDMRWWKAKLYQSIYSKCKDNNATLRIPQDVANEVLKIENKYRSKCHVCGKQWPEIMAYVDESDNASMKQMHLRCTLAHPLYEREPMFEEVRVMAGVD